MKNKDALNNIISDLKDFNFHISGHALERMAERDIAAIDIIALVKSESLNNSYWNEVHKSWNFTGCGFTNDPFTIACAYKDDGTLIITVFWE
jgi:hypothetical protein